MWMSGIFPFPTFSFGVGDIWTLEVGIKCIRVLLNTSLQSWRPSYGRRSVDCLWCRASLASLEDCRGVPHGTSYCQQSPRTVSRGNPTHCEFARLPSSHSVHHSADWGTRV